MENKETFITSVKENEGLIFKVASVYTNNKEDKKDLVQEIIYQLWKSYDTFNGKSSVSTWMYRVALNVAIHQLKVSKRRVFTIPIEDELMNYQKADTTDMEDKWQVFKQQIDNLNLLDKAIVLLYLDNKSYAEIAEITGISPTNVGTKLSRIKEKIKSKIFKQV